jgi:hypothetical protein
VQQRASLIDHIVGACEQRRRQGPRRRAAEGGDDFSPSKAYAELLNCPSCAGSPSATLGYAVLALTDIFERNSVADVTERTCAGTPRSGAGLLAPCCVNLES